jgi:hypothetical protein
LAFGLLLDEDLPVLEKLFPAVLAIDEGAEDFATSEPVCA